MEMSIAVRDQGANVAKRMRGAEWRRAAEADGPSQPLDPETELEDPLASLDHYPADQAQENIGYQKLAWYSAPFGSTGVALLVLALVVDLVRRVAKAGIRLLVR
jgi:hypothetical protein